MARGLKRRGVVGCVALAGLLLALLLAPVTPVSAGGPIWLATQQATFSATNKSAPSMATYRNHAYVLWLGDPVGKHTYYQVYFTTNASGTWQTRLLAAVGPAFAGAGDAARALLAVDPSIHRLYAAWPVTAGLLLYTSDNEGTTWQGPITVVKTTAANEIPANIALAAGGGKVAVAFLGNPVGFGIKPACTNGIADVIALTFSASTWSQPQDLTSCVSAKSNGFRTQRLAYDGTTGRFVLMALDDTNTTGLWYIAQGAGGAWSAPASTPMSKLADISGYYGDYRVAASGGTTYVVYALSTKPNTSFSYVDVFLGTHKSGSGWTVRRITQDPFNCEKFDVAVAAVPGRLALAYRWGGFCAKPSGQSHEYIHVLTGLPGHFTETVLRPATPTNCLRPVLAFDGPVFRVLQACSNTTEPGLNLFYTPEFYDVVGPATQITKVINLGPGTIQLYWTAQDPTPGSGVAYAEVQVRVNGGAWQTVAAAAHATVVLYRQAQPGNTYTFRVRARDKVNNWGTWVVSAPVKTT